ncbi:MULTISPECIES: hypothetical protein [unclassified Streptomyces]|uniref:hypothetical protein n=1 Tax=unclassified Streptomyces TaxID=2593676 RepID=UPI0011E64FD7|nr:hypothetical protein [Streptomyces sp. sk2.1]TXS72256.1 hypothetical protein EAO76_20040 [Streptomyces sp. sk2.1]
MTSAPRVLAVLDDLLRAATREERGALWQLAEQGRELDANLVRLPPGAEVGEHQEDVLDVLLVVVEGSGRITAPDGVLDLAPTTAVWLPRTSRRALAAGPDGLAYLTVHRRRPGLTIKSPTASPATSRVERPAVSPVAPPTPYDGGGEAPCMLDRVCPECGRLSHDPEPVFCSRCGQRFA